jgi:fluoride exporter
LENWYRVAVLSVGGVLGVNARFWLGVVINRWTSSQFPWATFTINITGSFAIGLCTAVLARWLPHPHARLLVIVGFLGGYTTFSSYSIESLTLWERGERSLCLAYLLGSVVAGITAVVFGTAVGRGLGQSGGITTAPGGSSSTASSQVFASRPGGRSAPLRFADDRNPPAVHPPAQPTKEPEAS